MILTEQYNYNNRQLLKLQYEICCLRNGLCASINTCLGISSEGSESLFLTQQGTWTSPTVTGSQNLQQVTDVGSTTSNNIVIQSDKPEIDVINNNGANVRYCSTGIIFDNSSSGGVCSLQLLPTDSGVAYLILPSQSPPNYIATQVNGVATDVTGNVEFSGTSPLVIGGANGIQYIDGQQASGKVLTSDAGGNASWQSIMTNGPTGSEPSTPYLGQFYFDTTLTKMKFWNGVVWAIIISTP